MDVFVWHDVSVLTWVMDWEMRHILNFNAERKNKTSFSVQSTSFKQSDLLIRQVGENKIKICESSPLISSPVWSNELPSAKYCTLHKTHKQIQKINLLDYRMILYLFFAFPISAIRWYTLHLDCQLASLTIPSSWPSPDEKHHQGPDANGAGFPWN